MGLSLAMDSETIEAKRQEAKQFKGVSYETDRNQFRADIYIKGAKTLVGRYETAEAAGLAFAKMREANPVESKKLKRKASGPKPLEQSEDRVHPAIVVADDVAERFGLASETAALSEFAAAVCAEIAKQNLPCPMTLDAMRTCLRRFWHQARCFAFDPDGRDDVVVFTERFDLLPAGAIRGGRGDRAARQANVRDHGSVVEAEAVSVCGATAYGESEQVRA